MSKADTLGTVARVIALLRTLAEHNHKLTLSEIANMLGLAPSTAHRLISLLTDEGLIARNPLTRTYYCDSEFVRIASLVRQTSSIVDLAQPHLSRLVEKFNETALLCLYLEKQQRCSIVNVLHGTELLRYDIKENVPLEMAWGSTARGILAFLPPSDIDAILSKAGPSATGELPSPRGIKAELEKIRKQGYVFSTGQRVPGSIGLGAPIFEGSGKVVGSMCLTIPKDRFLHDKKDEYAAALMDEAGRLSASLGYSAGR